MSKATRHDFLTILWLTNQPINVKYLINKQYQKKSNLLPFHTIKNPPRIKIRNLITFWQPAVKLSFKMQSMCFYNLIRKRAKFYRFLIHLRKSPQISSQERIINVRKKKFIKIFSTWFHSKFITPWMSENFNTSSKTCQVSKPITFNECHEIDALWHIFHSSMVLHKICMSGIYVWRCMEG